jgi:WD40 repeat protein
MRLWPTTPRGTWILASVAWAVGCSLVWGVLPVRPRAEWVLPEPTLLLGFGPDGTSVLTVALPFQAAGGADQDWPADLNVRAMSTGRVVATLRVSRGAMLCRVSPDGRWCVAPEHEAARSHRLFDVANRRLVATLEADGPWCFSPDRAVLAYGSAGVNLWDLTRGRAAGALPAATFPVTFSADGRFVAATAARRWGQPAGVRVWDRADLTRPVAEIRYPPSVRSADELALSDDGARLAVGSTVNFSFWSSALRVSCVDVADGRLRLDVPDYTGRFAFARGGRVLAVECVGLASGWGRSKEQRLRWWDVEAGRLLADDEVESDAPGLRFPWDRVAGALPSPDGRVVQGRRLVVVQRPLGQWAARLGLPWPVTTDSPRPAIRLWDAPSGRRLADLPCDAHGCWWSPDGGSLAVMESRLGGSAFQLWDVPPRRPVSWFFASAAALAIPLAALARRRTNRLRRAAA